MCKLEINHFEEFQDMRPPALLKITFPMTLNEFFECNDEVPKLYKSRVTRLQPVLTLEHKGIVLIMLLYFKKIALKYQRIVVP